MSKIAKKIAEHLVSFGWPSIADWSGMYPAPNLIEEIDRAIEGKIISKSEVDALRKDAGNMQEAQDSYNYVESLNRDLRRENERLNKYRENAILERAFLEKRIEYFTNIAYDNLALQLAPPIIIQKPGGIFETEELRTPWWKFWE